VSDVTRQTNIESRANLSKHNIYEKNQPKHYFILFYFIDNAYHSARTKLN